MNLIVDKLWLGNWHAAQNEELLITSGISHILTLERQEVALNYSRGFSHKFVDIPDAVHADILQHFDDCFAFMNEGRKAGGVLVHCFQGVSRSATIVIAYLMKTENRSFLNAYNHVRNCRPQIRPNPSFQNQLELFSKMGCQVDKRSRLYRNFQLSIRSRDQTKLHEKLPVAPVLYPKNTDV